MAAAGIRVPRKVERDVMVLVNDRDLQLNLSITATLGTEESSRCEEVAVNGGGEGKGVIRHFFRKYVYLRSMFIVLISCFLYPIVIINSIMYNIYI